MRQRLGALLSIMMLIPVFAWGQDGQSGGGSSSSGSQSTAISTKNKAIIEQNTLALPKTILTKGCPIIQTRAEGNSVSADSLVKIINKSGTTSGAMGWNTAFNQIQSGETILLYQNVTLDNKIHIIPGVHCTIDGSSTQYELHYKEGDQEKDLILDADVTFKNIKLFSGLLAWGHAVVFDSNVTLSENYSVWGGEFRDEGHTVNGREDYVVGDTHITIKSGTFDNIYGGSSNGKITGSTNVTIEGGTINNVYGGNSTSKAEAIPGDTHVTVTGGTIQSVFGGGAFGAVTGSANLTISGNPTISKEVYGGGHGEHGEDASVTSTQVKIQGGTIQNIFGAGAWGTVKETANLTISDNPTINGLICGGGQYATAKNTIVNIQGGTFGNGENVYWVFGGGMDAPVTETASMTISGGTFNQFLACGGSTSTATCQNTSLTITGGTFNKWIYGGGHTGNVTQTAKMDVSGGAFGGSICAAGCMEASSCGNTDLIISNVTLGDNAWVYGGGEVGDVSGTAKVTVNSGTINKTVFGGGCTANASCGNTEVTINGGTIGWVYGGGNLGNVTGNTQVTVNGGGTNIYCCGSGFSGTTSGNVSMIAKGGTFLNIRTVNIYLKDGNDAFATVEGNMNITIEGSNVAFNKTDGQIDVGRDRAKPDKTSTLTFKDCGTNQSPYVVPYLYHISEIVMENSFITSYNDREITFINDDLTNPFSIKGTGDITGTFGIGETANENIPEAGTIIMETEMKLSGTVSVQNHPLYKVGKTYRYGGANPDYKTVNIAHPDAAIGTLSVKLSDGTELDDGNQVPANTVLTIATTATAGKTLTVKNGNNTITGGTLTVNADINLTVEVAGSLDLAKQSTDITISKEGDQWQYFTTPSFRSTTGKSNFNGVVTGKLPDNKVIQIDGTAKGELTFDNAEVEAGTTGTAITIAAGANITIAGSLKATSGESSSYAIVNNGSLTLANGANVTATNSATGSDNGIQVTDNATLVAESGSTLEASGLDNSGTVVAKDGSDVSKPSGEGGGSDTELLKTYSITITVPDNGNVLTVKAGEVAITSGDKVTEGTELSVTATPASHYEATAITVTPEDGTAQTIGKENGSYTMGTAAITIAASFKYNAPYVPPVVYIYTVTLPDVEGATLNRKAGEYAVEEGHNFSFTLTLEDEYSESVPVVTTDHGETLTPDNNGKYTIRNVEEDIVVSITGIVKNTPTAIEGVEAGTKVWAARGTLFIRSSAVQQAEVFSLAGIPVRRLAIPAGYTEVNGLQAGIYIVRLTDGTVGKAMISK